MSSLDLALQRALAVRLNLQISLSQFPIVEEWMDIHLDRWLEHNPMPPDMPDGQAASYLAMLGSDLRRVWWGAWGDPRGFIPKMADYFKLCNIAKSDARALDQIGEHLEPTLVGSWIGVWGGKVTTGWHFMDRHPWSKVEAMFGTHEAKFTLKKWVEDNKIEQIERFTQSIGEEPFSEVELAMPGISVEEQILNLSQAFVHFTNAPLAPALIERLHASPVPELSLAVRIRGGVIARVGALAPGMAIEDMERLCTDAKVDADPKLGKLAAALGQGISRVEYGRAGTKAGVDIYLVPGDPANKPAAPVPREAAN
ncbi:MAG: hypothetical protein H0T79_11095 [Deltaproteobacteria bacterium]|nr:hypothetical protein [Deltaproteobacteria bacterium]